MFLRVVVVVVVIVVVALPHCLGISYAGIVAAIMIIMVLTIEVNIFEE